MDAKEFFSQVSSFWNFGHGCTERIPFIPFPFFSFDVFDHVGCDEGPYCNNIFSFTGLMVILSCFWIWFEVLYQISKLLCSPLLMILVVYCLLIGRHHQVIHFQLTQGRIRGSFSFFWSYSPISLGELPIIVLESRNISKPLGWITSIPKSLSLWPNVTPTISSFLATSFLFNCSEIS